MQELRSCVKLEIYNLHSKKMPPPIEKYPDAMERLEQEKERTEETPLSCFNVLEKGLRDLEESNFPEAVKVRGLKTLVEVCSNEHIATLLKNAQERKRELSLEEVAIKAKESVQGIIESLLNFKEACDKNGLDTGWLNSFQGETGELDERKVSAWAVDVYQYHRKVFDQQEGDRKVA